MSERISDELARWMSASDGKLEITTEEIRAAGLEIVERRAAQISADRVRDAVRREVLDRTACVAGWDGFLPGSIKRMADDIANRVADRLTTFEDGGKPRNRQALGPHATQQGAATPGQGATAQGAAQAAGNVAEPQLGPTPDRAERPPSSPFPAGRSTPPGFRDVAILVDRRGKQWKYNEPADVWSLVTGHLGPGSVATTSYQRLVADFGPMSMALTED